MDKAQAWRYERAVDEIDELIARAFYDTELYKLEGGPLRLRCYLMLVALLRDMGQYSPGLDVDELGQELKRYIGDQLFRKVQATASKIAEKILSIVEPTYTAASYWSPIDPQRRRTVLYRNAVREDEDEKRLLAYAYAFYALTFSGSKKKLYSATQYTAEAATRKRGVRVTYRNDSLEESEGEPPDNWWHLPASSHAAILKDTGLTKAIESCLLTDEVSTQALRNTLGLMLLNKRETPFGLNKFTRKFFSEFPGRALKVSAETGRLALETQNYVNELFDAGLDEKQALFMMMTNLVYDRAFPSNYFYAFPVRFNDYCSVMTFGTNAALSPLQYICLTRIAHSIFMHPLLLDYGTKETETVKSTSKMLLMSGFAHAANNALRIANIDSLVSLLSSGAPPARARFKVETGDDEGVLYGLRSLWMGGKAAESFIALIEMLTRPGNLRKKFTSPRPYTIDECVSEAQRMVDVYVEGQNERLPKLAPVISRRHWVNALLPAGYLDYVYVCTLLYELLVNVCKYGLTEMGADSYYAEALIATLVNKESLEIHVRNRIDPETRWNLNGTVALPEAVSENEQSGKSFLQFASALSTHISGIKITSKIKRQSTGEKYYEAILSLGPILVEVPPSKVERVSPVLPDA
jgi:hypothetical protein